MPRENRILRMGDKAPHFVLPMARNGNVSLDDILKGGHLILNFFRGTW
jgi:peroxiredoxin